MATKTAPKNLGPAGKKLWREVVKDHDLSPSALSTLEDVCRETDIVARLEEELANSPTMVKGSMGQLVASPLITEVRQHRATKTSMLKSLQLGSQSSAKDKESATTEQARAAARARWDRSKLKVV